MLLYNQFFCLPPVYPSGSLTVLLDIHPNGALVMSMIPPCIFLGISFKIKADTQIVIAAIMSVLYAFIMMIAAIVIIGTQTRQSTKPDHAKRFLELLSLILILFLPHQAAW